MTIELAQHVDSTTHRASLRRALNARSIAFVGVRDGSEVARFIEPTLGSDAELFFVHPKHDTVFGRPAYPSLSAIGKPVDIVFSALSAEKSVALVEESAQLGCGAVIVYAAGFAETDDEGARLQDRLTTVARRTGMAVLGPNALGWVNVPRDIRLTAATDYQPTPGGISLISHSGAMINSVAAGAQGRTGVGINHLISVGNEAVTDLADFLDFLADDPATTAIALIVESIRRPKEFFEAAAKARRAGKPIAALKLARSERTQSMAASHTGAIASDAWGYDVAFAEAGIAIASDPADLIDRLAIADQLERTRWTDIEALGVIATTGGNASFAYDVAEQEGVPMPRLDTLKDWISEKIPGVTIPNPLDTTGFGAQYWTEVIEKYLLSPELDALLLIHNWGSPDDSETNRWLVREVVSRAHLANKPIVFTNGAGATGDFVQEEIRDQPGIAVGAGIRPTLRGLSALKTYQKPILETRPADVVPTKPAPKSQNLVQGDQGATLNFSATMQLFEEYGIPIAPYHLVTDGEKLSPSFEGPYVAKLADVNHRSELKAVRIGLNETDLASAISELQKIAMQNALPDQVVIQQMVDVEGEVIVGVVGDTGFSPIVLLGLGGILVEVIKRVSGRLAPLSLESARELIAEFDDVPILHGYRGSLPCNLDELAKVLVAVGRLAAENRGWLESLDINPLVWGANGVIAVDGLVAFSPSSDTQLSDG